MGKKLKHISQLIRSFVVMNAEMSHTKIEPKKLRQLGKAMMQVIQLNINGLINTMENQFGVKNVGQIKN